MRQLRRWLVRSGLALLATVLIAAGTLAWLAWASLPETQGELTVAGIEQPITIVRDAYAIPHVEAAERSPTHTLRWASCTARTGCGKWSSTACSARDGWPRC